MFAYCKYCTILLHVLQNTFNALSWEETFLSPSSFIVYTKITTSKLYRVVGATLNRVLTPCSNQSSAQAFLSISNRKKANYQRPNRMGIMIVVLQARTLLELRLSRE